MINKLNEKLTSVYCMKYFNNKLIANYNFSLRPRFQLKQGGEKTGGVGGITFLTVTRQGVTQTVINPVVNVMMDGVVEPHIIVPVLCV